MLTACVGAGLVALLAYVASRRLVPGHQVLGFLALSPVVIPGVVLAVGLFIAYTRPPLLLYGTLWILFVAYLTKEMPVGYSQSDATFRGIRRSSRKPAASSGRAACACCATSRRRSPAAGSSPRGASSSSA